MAVKIQFRRDTQSNWESTNPILSQGELGLDTTNNRFKMGDGSTAWNSLDYTVDFLPDGTYPDLRAQATTAEDVGLENVTNESKATMFTDPTFTGTVSGVTKTHVGLSNVTNDAQIPLSQKGQADGVATLDSSGLVPASQLPSYVDDVLEFADFASLPATGETGKIYVTLDTNTIYRWTGSQYLEISNPIDIASTAEAEAGTDDTKLMTPLKTKQAIDELVEPGLILEDLPNQASISDETDTGSVTTTHKNQVNSSFNSSAGGSYTQVNASSGSNIYGFRGQINASSDCTASNNNQVNASYDSSAQSDFSQVNTSSASFSSKDYSQVNASNVSITTGFYSQINASNGILNDVDYSVAGGYGSSSSPYSTANRTWHIFSQTGNISIAGTLSSNSNFSDFAELFPNATGKEQGYGLLQTLDGYGVKPAQENDKVVGVVSATAGVLLNDTSFHWQGRYLVDEWGKPVMEEIKNPRYKLASEVKEKEKENSTYKVVEKEEDIPLIKVQKQNPDYEIEREQVSRKDRPDEWTVVGLTGQVYVRLNKDVKVGDSVKAWKDGIGQTSETDTNIIVMKITQPYDNKKGYAIGFCLIK